jgi:hypothetical protein
MSELHQDNSGSAVFQITLSEKENVERLEIEPERYAAVESGLQRIF